MQLSIVTINYNNASGLKQTLQSVFEQSFKGYEHIVIDGNSSDDSVEVIKEFSHISYWISEPDNGIYDAMNKGIKQAKGEYCLFLNSGDYFANFDVLSKAFKMNFTEDIVYGYLIWKSKQGKIIHRRKPPAFFIDFFVEHTLPHASSFIKTELLIKLKCYRTDLLIVSDWAFFLEAIFKYSASYRGIPISISIFTEGGISERPENFALLQREREQVWKDLFPCTYKDIFHFAELKKAWKIPGIKFLMKYIYPIYKKMRDINL